MKTPKTEFGDIILSFPRYFDFFSYIIRLKTNGWSHARIAISDKKIIEAVADGGVRLANVAKLRDYHWVQLRVKEPLSQKEKEKIYRFLLLQIGKKYDYIGAATIVFNKNANDPDKWFCFELVKKAFNQADIKLLDKPSGLFLAPDFEKSELLYIVAKSD